MTSRAGSSFDKDSIAPLIPWYANGTLEPDERRQVDEHLPGCPICRGLLEQARLYRSVGDRIDDEMLPGHVDAQLLFTHVRHPRRLGAETTAWIRSHLDSCALCADAAAIAAALPDADRRRGSFWESLSRTLLHPVPALAYLILLAGAGLVLIRVTMAPPTIDREVMVLPEPVRLFGETAFRHPGESPAESAAPPVPRPSGGSALHVTLMSGLTADDLELEAFTLRLTLTRGEHTLWAQNLAAQDVGADGEIGVLIPAQVLHAKGVYTLTLDYIQPGGDLDGQTAFSQRFILE